MLSVSLHVEEAEEGEDGERQAEEDAGLPPGPHGEARQRGGQVQVRNISRLIAFLPRRCRTKTR